MLPAMLTGIATVSGFIFVLKTRPGGLEPPTSGFGDLRSTN